MAADPRWTRSPARECGDPYDPFCQHRLITDTTGTALYMEGEGTASLGVLRSLVSEMSGFPGRKTVVLVSGGIIASDTPGGRPDLADLGIIIGKEAALANTAVYTLFIDSSFIDRFTAQTRKGDKNLGNWNRDSALLSRWLEQFTGAAGGALFNVQVGNAESAFARIRSELASYYLLGVEPADEDRDGRTHEISVKTSHPNVTIRGRRWVMVPLRRGGPSGATKAAAKTAAPAEPTPAPAAEPAPAAPVPSRRPRRGPGDRRRVRSRQLCGGRKGALAAEQPRQPHPGVPLVRHPLAERSEANRGVRARDGVCRTSQRQRCRRAKKADGCSPSITPACASRPAPTRSSAAGS